MMVPKAVRTSLLTTPTIHRIARVALSILILVSLLGCQAPVPQAAPLPSPGTPANPAPTAAGIPQPDYWPTAGWKFSSPERQGMDSAKLADIFAAIEQAGLHFHSVLVIRNGYLVAEAYYAAYTPTVKQWMTSVTKSVTSMATGIAVNEGKIKSLSQPILNYFPGSSVQNLDARKRGITVENLLTMTSGLDCNDFTGTRDKMYPSPSWVQFTLDLPMSDDPGHTFRYCSPAVQVLTAIVQQATGKTERELLNEALFPPLGIPAASENEFLVDPQGINQGFGGLYLAPRDMAKLGFLYLHGGNWDGKQVIPAAWVADSLARHTTEPAQGRGYGYLIWLYLQGYQSMMGLGGQDIHMIPSKNMVVVFTAGIDDKTHDTQVIPLLDQYLVPAAVSDKPLPANPAAFDKLQAAIARAATPVMPVPKLPARAVELSGKVWNLDENQRGWRSVSLEFMPGKDEATVNINGSLPVRVGLDNVYRTADFGEMGQTHARGKWDDETAFEVDASEPGEFTQWTFRFEATGENLVIKIADPVTGTKYDITGTLAH